MKCGHLLEIKRKNNGFGWRLIHVPVKLSVFLSVIEANKALFVEDELLIVQGKVQTDRFNGGLRLNIGQMWDLPAARARFGRHLAMAVDGGVPALLDLVRTWPARRVESDEGERLQGLGMRLLLSRPSASAELDLGDSGRFWPCDEALARCKALAHEGRANVVYE